MTGLELKTIAEDILDNNVDWSDDHFYVLLNIAKTKLEEQRLWQYLKKLDSNGSSTLPTDFSEDYKVMIGTSVECFPVPFEEQKAYSNSSNYYYIDWANLTITFLGTRSPGTINLFYKRFTPELTETTSPVFPERFHPLLAYYVASIHQGGTDSDEIFARMSPVNRQAAIELEQAMKSWNSQIAIHSQGDRLGVSNSNNSIPLELM